MAARNCCNSHARVFVLQQHHSWRAIRADLVRLIAGSDHRIVLPASALAGGSLLVIADTLARTIVAPRQLPVGALTAAIGVPLFLVLMSRLRTERYR